MSDQMSSSMPPLSGSSLLSPLTTEATEANGLSNRLKWALIVTGLGTACLYLYYRRRVSKDNVNQTVVKRLAESHSETDSQKTPLAKAREYKLKGNRLFKDSKYSEAIDCYTKAIDVCPEDQIEDLSTYYQNRAASYEMLNKYQEVIEDCNKAIHLNKRYVKALVRRAKAKEKTGDTKNALFDITAACILEQFSKQDNLLMTDRILREQSKIKAKALFKTRTPRLPSEHFITHYFMSYSKDPILKNCEPKQIVDHLEDLRQRQEELNTIFPEYLLLKGTIEILKGNIEGGEQDLERIMSLQECDLDVKVNALIKLGTIKVQDIGRDDSFTEALEYFDRAVKLDDTNPDIYLHRAQIHLLSERVDNAYNDLEKCCQLDSSFASAFAQKLYVQFRCGIKFNDENTVMTALNGFKEAISRFTKSSEVFSLYAQALMERGDFSKADQYFDKAIETDPKDGNLYVHRGILFLQSSNDVEQAIKLLEKAKAVDPNCQFAYEMLGSIQVQRGLLSEGIQLFDLAIELAQTELDCSHLFSLRDAAEAQEKATKMLGIEIPAL